MKTTNRVKAVRTPKAAKVAKPVAALEKGQLYQMKDMHLEIMEVGKLLAHYRLLLRLDQRGVPLKLGTRDDVQAFLTKNGARLVRR